MATEQSEKLAIRLINDLLLDAIVRADSEAERDRIENVRLVSANALKGEFGLAEQYARDAA